MGLGGGTHLCTGTWKHQARADEMPAPEHPLAPAETPERGHSCCSLGRGRALLPALLVPLKVTGCHRSATCASLTFTSLTTELPAPAGTGRTGGASPRTHAGSAPRNTACPLPAGSGGAGPCCDVLALARSWALVAGSQRRLEGNKASRRAAYASRERAVPRQRGEQPGVRGELAARARGPCQQPARVDTLSSPARFCHRQLHEGGGRALMHSSLRRRGVEEAVPVTAATPQGKDGPVRTPVCAPNPLRRAEVTPAWPWGHRSLGAGG